MIEIIFENENLLVVNKPPHLVVFSEEKSRSLIDLLIEQYPFLKKVGSPPRYGLVHRLDKETSGVLLIAKNEEALIFFQKQFKKREIEKKYLALVTGEVKNEKKIETLIGRSNKKGTKQKAYSLHSPLAKNARKAVTEYKILKKYEDYTLLEVIPETGRKHQIRVHLSHVGNPIVGDKKYGFKKQKSPQELNRHFLHAQYLKLKLLDNTTRRFQANVPDDLQKILKKLN